MIGKMTPHDYTSPSTRETFNLGDPVSVLGVCLDEEMWRLIAQFAQSTGLIQLRGRIKQYRSNEDQDSALESLGNLSPDICLVDFDTHRPSAVTIA